MALLLSFNTSLKVSLIIQLISGIIGSYVLLLKIKPEYNYLYSLMFLDTLVQFTEAFYYSLFIYYGVSAEYASKLRYYDWFITTPVMLLITIALVFYNSQHSTISSLYHTSSETQHNNTLTRERDKLYNINKINQTFSEKLYNTYIYPVIKFINHSTHKQSVGLILISNFFMLLFGYLGEQSIITRLSATVIGFIFFFISFYVMFADFIVKYGNTMTYYYYAIFTTVWGLYGIAYLFNEETKNIMYNGLDLISKNIYGLILSYIIYTMSE
jgi:hypothetical protein